MEIISFDVGGKMAHFRKYYANNIALSYTVPPRTTLMGLLAAILGRGRDTYYKEMASDNLRIGVQLLSPVKKTFHRLNYLSIKTLGDIAKDSLGDFTGRNGRIQTPVEMVTGYDLSRDFVKYRVFLAADTEGVAIFDEIKKALIEKRSHYNLSLGVANSLASINNIRVFFDVREVSTIEAIDIHSAVASEYISFPEDEISNFNLEEELLPLDFLDNHNRELKNLGRFLFSNDGQPFKAKVSCSYFQLNTEGGNSENIFFLEK